MRNFASLAVVGAALTLFACSNGAQNPVSMIPGVDLPHSAKAHPLEFVEAELHYFGNSGDGANPYAGVIDPSGMVIGTVYGTTANGGANGSGTVFAVTVNGGTNPSYMLLHSFGGAGDGVTPYAGLIDVGGTFYGTTTAGGANGSGTVFAITPSGKETVLHSFGGAGDGTDPQAALVNVKGTLYGTTVYGGADGSGTVFSITRRSGTETVLHSFGASGDGAYPLAGLINVNGTLYGTTGYGGTNSDGDGTAFAITPSGTETVLHSFGGSGDGRSPSAGLVNVKGKLYGTTYAGGANGSGTVFSIARRSGRETVLHSFGASGDGANPTAGLIYVNGSLWGTTQYGGTNNDGTAFAITLSGMEVQLWNFGTYADYGAHPVGGLISVSSSCCFSVEGTTALGGLYGGGVFFNLALPPRAKR